MLQVEAARPEVTAAESSLTMILYVGWLMAPTDLFEGQLDRTYQNAWTSAETLLSFPIFQGKPLLYTSCLA
ncbi:hypothetical protein J4Q44_G00071520 [Coregonus suidteri]|uniref:Uncharacterized protein n=1 Tax=Coregonus suidteri TaxID=861788 RepID=A0AAN8MEP1_9TELE